MKPTPGGFHDNTPAPVVALRDLDNDGDADLIGGGRVRRRLHHRRRDHRPSQRRPGYLSARHVAYLLGNFVSDPWSLATADLNGDGFADILASTPSGRASEGYVVLPSNGTGSFGAPAYYEAEQWTYAAAAFDADGDGDADVATVARFSAALTVHANPGSGTFRILTRYPLAQMNDAVESADIDNDGDLDIVTNNEVQHRFQRRRDRGAEKQRRRHVRARGVLHLPAPTELRRHQAARPERRRLRRPAAGAGRQLPALQLRHRPQQRRRHVRRRRSCSRWAPAARARSMRSTWTGTAIATWS